MPVVRLDIHYDPSNLFRQTPDCLGKWDDYTFTTEAISDPDYLVVANFPFREIDVQIPAKSAYLVSQEPPITHYKWTTRYFDYFDFVITSWPKKYSKKVINDQGMLHWHIKKSYDELLALQPGDVPKQDKISSVTSNLRNRSGHRLRLNFLKSLKNLGFEFDLYGKGFNPVEDKYDALKNYKYSIAIENYSCNDYWTEKLSDCFLSWTMPVYYGCSNITKYFPKEAMILIDPSKPKEAIEIINRALAEDAWTKNLDAIAEARNKILNEYQFFPGIINHIESQGKQDVARRHLRVPKAIIPKQSIYDKFVGFLIKNF